LFFSDHCECGKTILLDDVVRKVPVEFFCLDGKLQNPGPPPKNEKRTHDIGAEFFIRQKYHTIEDNIHISTLTPTDLSPSTTCPCRAVTTLPTYIPGEYVLLKDMRKDRLQPFRFEYYEGDRAWVRRMDRRREVEDGVGKVNELVWTESVIDVSPKWIVRRCRVVCVPEEQAIPKLADWNGCCDRFFYREQRRREVKMEEAKEGKMEDVKDGPSLDSEVTRVGSAESGIEMDEVLIPNLSTVTMEPEQTMAIDSHEPPEEVNTISPAITENCKIPFVPDYEPPPIIEDKKLRGLDLFCGGGNFGRGIADGGAVIHKWFTLGISHS
jgi:hypothetical protein